MARTTSYFKVRRTQKPVRGRRSTKRVPRTQVMPKPYTVRWQGINRKPRLSDEDSRVSRATSTGTGTVKGGGTVDPGHPGKGLTMAAHRLPPRLELPRKVPPGA